jgi:hypothetical protein
VPIFSKTISIISIHVCEGSRAKSLLTELAILFGLGGKILVGREGIHLDPGSKFLSRGRGTYGESCGLNWGLGRTFLIRFCGRGVDY